MRNLSSEVERNGYLDAFAFRILRIGLGAVLPGRVVWIGQKSISPVVGLISTFLILPRGWSARIM